jgi:hypothetical protein
MVLLGIGTHFQVFESFVKHKVLSTGVKDPGHFPAELDNIDAHKQTARIS